MKQKTLLAAIAATALLAGGSPASGAMCGTYLPCGNFSGPTTLANDPAQPVPYTEKLIVSEIGEDTLVIDGKYITPEGTVSLAYKYDLKFASEGKFSILEGAKDVGNGSCKGTVCVYQFFPSDQGSAAGGFTATKEGIIRTQVNHWSDGTIDLFQSNLTPAKDAK
ncbi:MAG: hypothetical protein EOP11_13765 [Proteobacteria bacterium]|nr:MAG: hypothetical protein EOP11_13765 [Pseudomonadota bacterium]